MAAIVLDTCGVIAWMAGTRLPPAGADLLVSAITWCEIAWKHQAGALPLPLPRDQCIATLEAAGLTTVAIDTATLLAAVDLDWGHRDPADRIIVALARARRAPVFTCDRVIAGFHPQCVW